MELPLGTKLNSVHTRCVVKTSDLQGVFVKIVGVKSRCFLVVFLAIFQKKRRKGGTPLWWTRTSRH